MQRLFRSSNQKISLCSVFFFSIFHSFLLNRGTEVLQNYFFPIITSVLCWTHHSRIILKNQLVDSSFLFYLPTVWNKYFLQVGERLQAKLPLLSCMFFTSYLLAYSWIHLCLLLCCFCFYFGFFSL